MLGENVMRNLSELEQIFNTFKVAFTVFIFVALCWLGIGLPSHQTAFSNRYDKVVCWI